MMNSINVEEGSSPLTLTMPHSARDIPDGVDHKLDVDSDAVIRAIGRGVDACVPLLSGFHDYDNATRIHTELPTAVLNVNRVKEQADKYAVEGGSERLDAHGMIPRATYNSSEENIQPLLTEKYSQEEFENLLDYGYWPWVEAIRESMQRSVDKHGTAIQFDLHSMEPRRYEHVTSGKWENAYLIKERLPRGSTADGKMPDFVLLDKGPEYCDPEISDLVTKVIESHDFLIEQSSVRPSEVKPSYSMFADPDKGRHSLGIEIVGRGFEIGRHVGNPVVDESGAKEYREAFQDVYQTLESYGT